MMDDDPRSMHNMAIHYETQTVQLLRREIIGDMHNPRDELLFAMLLLSARSTDETPVVVVKRVIGAFRPPLTNLHNLAIGSSIRFGDLHRETLKRLIAQKGGVAEIVMPGLGEFFNT
jgi:hypothetical protein